MIEHFRHGSIIIDGKSYTIDVKLSNNTAKTHLLVQRHLLEFRDVEDILKDCEVFIIGSGTSEQLKADPKIEEYCKAKGIVLIIQNSSEAWQTYNSERERKKAGFIHITC